MTCQGALAGSLVTRSKAPGKRSRERVAEAGQRALEQGHVGDPASEASSWSAGRKRARTRMASKPSASQAMRTEPSCSSIAPW